MPFRWKIRKCLQTVPALLSNRLPTIKETQVNNTTKFLALEQSQGTGLVKWTSRKRNIRKASICFVEAETKRETASSGKLFFSSVCKELEGCELKRRIRICLQSEVVLFLSLQRAWAMWTKTKNQKLPTVRICSKCRLCSEGNKGTIYGCKELRRLQKSNQSTSERNGRVEDVVG